MIFLLHHFNLEVFYSKNKIIELKKFERGKKRKKKSSIYSLEEFS